jgi:hypothetical protein
VSPLDAEDLRFHAIRSECLLCLRTAAIGAACTSLTALGFHGPFHLVDYDCHHSTSN